MVTLCDFGVTFGGDPPLTIEGRKRLEDSLKDVSEYINRDVEEYRKLLIEYRELDKKIKDLQLTKELGEGDVKQINEELRKHNKRISALDQEMTTKSDWIRTMSRSKKIILYRLGLRKSPGLPPLKPTRGNNKGGKGENRNLFQFFLSFGSSSYKNKLEKEVEELENIKIKLVDR